MSSPAALQTPEVTFSALPPECLPNYEDRLQRLMEKLQVMGVNTDGL